MTFFLAPALVQLRDEVNDRFPNRDKASDGWIGDPSHAARKSDHNPCWSCTGKSEGIVRAIDIDISPDGRPNVDLRRRILKVTVGDPRVWYVISNQIIYSRTHDWVPLRYTGENGHFQHVHVSLNGANGINPGGNFDTSNWFPVKDKPEPDDSPRVSNFRESAPEWNVNILDRAIANGRVDLVPRVAALDAAVKLLPDDEGDTRVTKFQELYKKKRLLKLSLLNEAVADGRTGAVKKVRDDLRMIIKRILVN